MSHKKESCVHAIWLIGKLQISNGKHHLGERAVFVPSETSGVFYYFQIPKTVRVRLDKENY